MICMTLKLNLYREMNFIIKLSFNYKNVQKLITTARNLSTHQILVIGDMENKKQKKGNVIGAVHWSTVIFFFYQNTVSVSCSAMVIEQRWLTTVSKFDSHSVPYISNLVPN